MTFHSTSVKGHLLHFWDQQTLYWEALSSEESVTSAARRRATAFVPNGASVLDVGCGPCGNSVWLKARCRYIGLDLSLAGLKRAISGDLNLVCGDAEFMPFP